jgi:hypothetical protein
MACCLQLGEWSASSQSVALGGRRKALPGGILALETPLVPNSTGADPAAVSRRAVRWLGAGWIPGHECRACAEPAQTRGLRLGPIRATVQVTVLSTQLRQQRPQRGWLGQSGEPQASNAGRRGPVSGHDLCPACAFAFPARSTQVPLRSCPGSGPPAAGPKAHRLGKNLSAATIPASAAAA